MVEVFQNCTVKFTYSSDSIKKCHVQQQFIDTGSFTRHKPKIYVDIPVRMENNKFLAFFPRNPQRNTFTQHSSVSKSVYK